MYGSRLALAFCVHIRDVRVDFGRVREGVSG